MDAVFLSCDLVTYCLILVTHTIDTIEKYHWMKSTAQILENLALLKLRQGVMKKDGWNVKSL